MKRILLVMLSSIFILNCSYAQPINKVFVIGGSDTEDLKKCGASYESIVSSAKSALRFNRIEIATVNDADVMLGIQVLMIPTSPGYCASALNIQFFVLTDINLKKGKLTGTNELCSDLAIINSSKNQQQLNDMTKQIIDNCISQIETRVKR